MDGNWNEGLKVLAKIAGIIGLATLVVLLIFLVAGVLIGASC